MASQKPQHEPDARELLHMLEALDREARRASASIDDANVLPNGAARAAESAKQFDMPLPDEGIGATAAIDELLQQGADALANTAGPRCYHFVIGGSTPAATGADWLATLHDQLAYTWITSPLAVELERVSLNWLKELFDLPAAWPGVIVTGATMANFVALAAAKQWWGEQHGVDVSEVGMTGLPPCPVFSSGHIHASTLKCLSLLGIGRGAVRRCQRDATGRIDLDAMREGLESLNGAPAIIVANCGEVNAGDFDPINDIADLAREHNVWLHVDGAFGLFARVSPRTAHLATGVERADSVIVDGHKWLNVPYDCGFAWVRDHALLAKAFAYSAAYLPSPDDERPTPGAIGPESSRRARSFSVWATLRAYGRAGHRAIVERNLDCALHLANLVDQDNAFERLADVQANIVCFRFNPGDRDEAQLNTLNRRLGEAIVDDGRVYAGATNYGGKTALRPAFSNWRTELDDVDVFFDVVKELAASL